jgi:cold shock protein
MVHVTLLLEKAPSILHPAFSLPVARLAGSAQHSEAGTEIDNGYAPTVTREARGGQARPEETRMANGTIKRLVRDRGFGFIRDDGGQEWFFHRSAVRDGSFDQLNEGQRVSFEEEPSAKGPRAGNVRSEG